MSITIPVVFYERTSERKKEVFQSMRGTVPGKGDVVHLDFQQAFTVEEVHRYHVSAQGPFALTEEALIHVYVRRGL